MGQDQALGSPWRPVCLEFVFADKRPFLRQLWAVHAHQRVLRLPLDVPRFLPLGRSSSRLSTITLCQPLTITCRTESPRSQPNSHWGARLEMRQWPSCCTSQKSWKRLFLRSHFLWKIDRLLAKLDRLESGGQSLSRGHSLNQWDLLKNEPDC